jgi:hypothetical protein
MASADQTMQEAIQPFTDTELSRTQTVIPAGEKRGANDPVVKRHPDLFMPADLPDDEKAAIRSALVVAAWSPRGQ